MKKGKRILAIMLASVMMLSSLAGITAKADTCGGLEAVDVYQPAPDEVVQDPILHWAIRAAMNSINLNGQKLTAEMVGSASVKDISYELCAHPEDFETNEWKGKQFWIESLEGLQYAKSATMIDIAYTSAVEGKSIKDLSPLSGLTQLEKLILKQNGIDDISALSGLVNLTTLDLSSNNAIVDISAVKDMTKLTSLNISFNAIESVDAISNLENLEYLSVSDNKITTLPDLSKLTKVYFLDASHNQLTDVSEIAKMKNLQQLNLSGNTGIVDVTPLANLTKLAKDSTTLPDGSKKDDLFAAIEVNKLFELFNISKMRVEDLDNVKKALDAYDVLSDEQKTYMDSNKINAASSNMELVEKGEDPVYYPEYDQGEKQPEFKKLEIAVVDKYGNPMAGVKFVKTGRDVTEPYNTFTTNEQGKLIITHVTTDAYRPGEIIITPEGNDYVAEPAEITYTVAIGNRTETVNGNPATGLEELVFTLIPKDEYVDKSTLKEALANAENVEREYKYTEDSYQAYKNALANAQGCYEDVDAKKDEVDSAVAELNKAIDELTKRDILTQLKLVVKDTNGNIFHRAFKFQIRVPETGAEAWNDFTCPYSGAAYLKTSPGWVDGKVWEIVACYEEAYTMDPITVTIGVKDGQTYFKTVNGEPVGVDFEKEVVVTYVPENAEGARKPDRAIVQEAIEYVKAVNTAEYTPVTVANLTKAISDAEAMLNKSSVIQEDYNAVITELLKAKDGLVEVANKFQLQKELEKYYSESSYTTASWTEYKSMLEAARIVYNDGNATQEQVDQALEDLVKARSALVLRPDRSGLKAKLEAAAAISGDAYTEESFKALQDAIEKAQAVYDNGDATKAQIDEQIGALQEAIDGLEKKAVEPSYNCDPTIFRAKVIDEKGNPVAGVNFEAIIDGKKEAYVEIISNKNGIIEYYTASGNNGKTTYIKLADDRYTTTDEHYFEASGSMWAVTMTSIDGEPYDYNVETKLTYVVKEAGGETPDPDPEPTDKVLCDENTFRAKVVDEDGNPVEGVAFNLVPPPYYGVSTKTVITNKDGILEYETDPYDDYWLSYEVKLAGNDYVSEPEEISFTTGEEAVIMTVGGKVLEEAGEVVFVVKAAGGETPDPSDKVLSDQNNFRAKVVDEEGNLVSGVKFALVSGGTTAATLESDAKGVVTYEVGMYEGYKTYTVTLSDDRYTSESSVVEFVLEKYPTVITTINGKALEEAGEIVFVVKAAGGETPGVVNKKALDGQIDFSKPYEGKAEDYTAESYKKFTDALAEAKRVNEDENATQDQVDAAAEALKEARGGLIPSDKPEACDKSTIRIQVVYEDGTKVMKAIPFKVGTGTQNSTKGIIEYAITTADSGTAKIVVRPTNESEEIDGKTYIICPDQHEFTLEEYAGDITISAIDGEELNGTKVVKFVLKEQDGQSVDKDALEQKLAEAKAITGDKYTKDSYEALADEVKAAQKVYDNAEATQDEVDAAVAAIEAAIEALVLAPVSPFEDVKYTDYFYDAVIWAVENGITTGKTATTFLPNATCTRAQVVTFLWRAAGEPEATIENPFEDVKATDYSYEAILWAYENGITTGKTATTFLPNATVTRGQVATFLWRAEGKPEATIENPFEDVTEKDYFYDAVLWAYENEITTGKTETTFLPEEGCTRAQIVAFLYRGNN